MTKTMTATQKEMKRLAREYTKLNAKMKEINDKKKELAEQMEKIMKAENVDTVCVDEYTIRYKNVNTTRFDSKALKKNAIDIYNLYTKVTSDMRFTVDYTAPKTVG